MTLVMNQLLDSRLIEEGNEEGKENLLLLPLKSRKKKPWLYGIMSRYLTLKKKRLRGIRTLWKPT